jgi:hypothetical protein
MTDFPPGEAHGAADLLHLLTCPTCRSLAIGRLLDRQTSRWRSRRAAGPRRSRRWPKSP